MDALIGQEYRHIMQFGGNTWTPKMDAATAERIYVYCNALGAPDDDSQEDLDELRQAPMCSPIKPSRPCCGWRTWGCSRRRWTFSGRAHAPCPHDPPVRMPTPGLGCP